VDADPYAVPPVATEPEPSPRLITEPQEDPPFWAEWDHAGIFADLGFILSWCQGETLCIDDALGYGGRLRVGYRISSYFALSVSGAAAAFQPPTSTDAQALAQVDTTAVWFGIFPGLRYHPVNHFLLDPFIGVDLGWVWNYYIESAQLELAPGVDIPVDIQAAYGDLLKTRTMVTMNAFAFVPQVGLRLFLSRGAAIGVLVEYMIPLWDEVCSQVYTSVPDQSVDSPEQCRPVEEAGSLQPEGLDKASELPRHLNLEIDLAFLF